MKLSDWTIIKRVIWIALGLGAVALVFYGVWTLREIKETAATAHEAAKNVKKLTNPKNLDRLETTVETAKETVKGVKDSAKKVKNKWDKGKKRFRKVLDTVLDDKEKE
jgi:uncharacterized protein YoxC